MIRIRSAVFVFVIFLLTIPLFAQHIPSLTKLGEIHVLKPVEIESSPFSLGCETLDRELWEPKEVYPFLADLGIKWARLQTGWARCEQEKGNYTWGWLDEAVDGLLDIGIEPWLNVGYGNPLYTEGAARYHPMSNEEAYSAWKKFVVAMTKHYKDRIQYYEIWNEPNLGSFWKPDTPDAEKYAQLVAETAPLIRQNDPDAVIVGGVVSRIPYNYIKAALDAGLANDIDVFSFHPYTTYPETYNEQILALQRLLDSYKPGIKLWQGENGYPSQDNSTGFSGEGPWTEHIQAKTMLRRLLVDCALGVDLTNWFIVIDLHDYPKGSGRVNYKGILRAEPEIGPKVAFKSLQYLTSLVYGDVKPRNGIEYFSKEQLHKDDIEAFRFNDKETANDVFSTCLNTANGPVLAYWLVEKARDERVVDAISLVYEDWQGNGFENPVLVDPMFGEIYDLPKSIETGGSNTWKDAHRVTIWNHLPITDYPLLIMEKSQVMP